MEATTSIHLSNIPIHIKPLSMHFHISNTTLQFPLKSHIYPSYFTSSRHYCAVEGVALEEIPEKTQLKPQKKKLFVLNFPWTYNHEDLKKVFSECGTVEQAEIVRNKDGKYRGFAFITMSSGEEAQTVVDKFNSKELGGRTIKVEFSRTLRKTRSQSSTELPVTETHHKLYVSNLQWKARSSHLREFFSVDFNPVSARVVFEGPNGRSAGYGFVSFNTREEAEVAVSSLNGKEILGRPVILKLSKRTTNTEGEAANADGEGEGKENKDDPVSPIGKEVSETEQES